MTRPSKLTFVTCLLAAPALFAIIPALFTMGGEYLARFGYVGNLSLFVSLPAYLIVFGWLAWRAAKRGAGEMRPYVMAGLVANASSLLIFPVMIVLVDALGGGLLSDMLDDALQEATQAGGETPEAIPFYGAALFAGFAAFFVGLFTLPILTAIFGGLARRLKLERPNA